MTDRRPIQLSEHQESASEKNDKLIVDALAELENPAKRGKRKPTVAAVCQMTGLSRNTVRNRAWARDRIKAIKRKLKARVDAPSGVASAVEADESTPRVLRDRITSILKQNALLYEEVLTLREIIAERETEIRALTAEKVVPFPPPRGRATE
jgi:hypothetical protein